MDTKKTNKMKRSKIEKVREIDQRLMYWLPRLIEDELDYMVEYDPEDMHEDIQEFLDKDDYKEYKSHSPLMYQINKIIDYLYTETPYEKYRD